MKRLFFVLILSIFSIHTFAQSTNQIVQTSGFDQSQSLEVFVNAKGKIYVDGKKVDLEALEQQLSELKKRNGIVKFAKEQTTKKSALDQLTQVSKLFSKYERLVKVYTDKNFTQESLF